MDLEERIARQELDLKYAENNSTSHWTKCVLSDVRRAKKDDNKFTYMGYGLGLGFRVMEFGASFRKLDISQVCKAYSRSFRRLIVLDYGGTLVTVDNPECYLKDSFTRRFAKDDSSVHSRPNHHVTQTLRGLAKDPRNLVVVASGMKRETLESIFGDLREVSLAAEHGYLVRWPYVKDPIEQSTGNQLPAYWLAAMQMSSQVSQELHMAINTIRHSSHRRSTFAEGDLGENDKGSGSGWCISEHILALQLEAMEEMHRRDSGSDNLIQDPGLPLSPHRRTSQREQETVLGLGQESRSWKELALAIMDIYRQRTNGAYVETKESIVNWNYMSADPEFGVLQAKELRDHLEGVLQNFPVEFHSGKGYVEVRPRGVDKGSFVSGLLQRLSVRADTTPDFVMVIGDDVSDELAFNSAQEFSTHNRGVSRTEGGMTNDIQCFTITVGPKPSNAHAYLYDVEEVISLLDTLRHRSARPKTSYSMADLTLATPLDEEFQPNDSQELLNSSTIAQSHKQVHKHSVKTGRKLKNSNRSRSADKSNIQMIGNVHEKNHFDGPSIPLLIPSRHARTSSVTNSPLDKRVSDDRLSSAVKKLLDSGMTIPSNSNPIESQPKQKRLGK